jgi:calpain-15
MKLRNPWGYKEWMGDWSDSSDKWTAEIKAKLNFEDSDDGVFYMTYQHYMSYYRSTTICKFHDDFKYFNIVVPT